MEQNYKMVISYDGTRYHGWEHKQGLDTIQGKIKNVLSRLCDKDIDVIGAGRTDAGVHAKGMVANAVLDINLTERELQDYMNRYLPEDIAVENVKIASKRFHARLNAVGKTYCYSCFYGQGKPVFRRKYITVLDFTPDVEAMRKAASYLVGQHDFVSFCGNPKMKKSTVREIYDITIEARKGFLYLRFHGSGFLQNMVRIMTGTLLEVGMGTRQPDEMLEILAAKKRSVAGPTAPPQGLCLEEVYY